MDVTSLLGGGTVAGLIVALSYAVKQFADWRAKRADEPRAKSASAVADQAAANATLLKTLEGLQQENSRMARKIKHLEDEAEAKDRKIDSLEAALDEAKAEFSARIDAMQAQLAALKTHG